MTALTLDGETLEIDFAMFDLEPKEEPIREQEEAQNSSTKTGPLREPADLPEHFPTQICGTENWRVRRVQRSATET